MHLLTTLLTTITISSLTFWPVMLGTLSHLIGLKRLDMTNTVISTGFHPSFQRGEISFSASLPKPPNTGTPTGETTPGGGTRPEAIEACKPMELPLTALVENQSRDFTHREHPTFWFYVPYSAKEVTSLEFSFSRSQDLALLYEASIQLGDQPGIIGIPLPQDEKVALEPDILYEWRLVVRCSNLSSAQAQRVYGYVMYKPLPGDQARQVRTMTWQQQLMFYRNQDYWYDAISLLTELVRTQMEDAIYLQELRNLLQSGTEKTAAVASQPIRNITIVPSGSP